MTTIQVHQVNICMLFDRNHKVRRFHQEEEESWNCGYFFAALVYFCQSSWLLLFVMLLFSFIYFSATTQLFPQSCITTFMFSKHKLPTHFCAELYNKLISFDFTTAVESMQKLLTLFEIPVEYFSVHLLRINKVFVGLNWTVIRQMSLCGFFHRIHKAGRFQPEKEEPATSWAQNSDQQTGTTLLALLFKRHLQVGSNQKRSNLQQNNHNIWEYFFSQDVILGNVQKVIE